jgi:Zn-dependent peptidase ImmA (M78 family)
MDNWPEVVVRVEPLPGRLLGELCYPIIALAADSSPAQRRCTLVHEIVHLERGVRDCGPWLAREEYYVDRVVALRLLPLDVLAPAIRDAGGVEDLTEIARQLDVDTQTLAMRLSLLTSADRARVRTYRMREIWSVA